MVEGYGEIMKIVLASSSPRRKHLMGKAGFKFEIDPADIDERAVKEKSLKKLVEKLAIMKAKEVAKRHKNSVVIGSDLMVSFRGKQIGKPNDNKDAKNILKMLRGNTHQIMTGVAVINTESNKIASKVDVADVIMRNYSEKEIDDYIATGETESAGGAYQILREGKRLVEKFEGDIETISGLPTKVVFELMEKVK